VISVEGGERYSRSANSCPLRQVDQALQIFDCVACNNCVTVCPNNAFLGVDTAGVGDLEAKTQYLVLAELCNDCGNCTTFCPEDGQPQLIKPRLYTDGAARSERQDEGFLVHGSGDELTVTGPDPAADVIRQLLARWSR